MKFIFHKNIINKINIGGTVKNCSICDSNKKICQINEVNYCSKHYLQMKRHGKILERTRYTPNDFIIKDNIVEIYIYNNNFEKVAIGIFSLNKLNKIIKHKWSLTKEGYVFTYENKKYIYLHRLIMDAQPDEFIDHINHDTLNNCDENLRKCTNAQNLQNHAKLPSDNTSGVIGVYWIKSKNKWRAEIQCNKEKINLGYFIDKEDAIKARQEAEEKYFKEFKSIKNILLKEIKNENY